MSTTPIDPLLARPLQAGGDAAAGHSHVTDADPTTAEVAPTSVADDVDIDVVVVVESFEVAYQRLYPQLVRLAYLLVDTVERAEEAVQEAFAKAYPKWGRIERPDTYMRTAVVNTCRRVQRPPSPAPSPPPSPATLGPTPASPPRGCPRRRPRSSRPCRPPPSTASSASTRHPTHPWSGASHLCRVRVFVVLGTTDVTTCTIPWCDTAITPDAPLTDAP